MSPMSDQRLACVLWRVVPLQLLAGVPTSAAAAAAATLWQRAHGCSLFACSWAWRLGRLKTLDGTAKRRQSPPAWPQRAPASRRADWRRGEGRRCYMLSVETGTCASWVTEWSNMETVQCEWQGKCRRELAQAARFAWQKQRFRTRVAVRSLVSRFSTIKPTGQTRWRGWWWRGVGVHGLGVGGRGSGVA